MDTTQIPIIQYIPEKYRGVTILAILVFPYVTRAYYAIANGGGIVGAVRGILWGTNAAKPKSDAP